ncbi:MAG: hypothetical protein ACRYHA_19940 [Janthinobacterium lividum]
MLNDIDRAAMSVAAPFIKHTCISTTRGSACCAACSSSAIACPVFSAVGVRTGSARGERDSTLMSSM